MRKYTCAFGVEVDLDNPDTYNHLPDDLKKLDDMMFKEIGQALVYMDYWMLDIFGKERKEPDMERGWTKEQMQKDCPDWFANSGFYQRERVYKLIKNFADNRRDNFKNILWYKEQIFLFQDETENMC